MALGLLLELGWAMRRKRPSSLQILSSKRPPETTTSARTASPLASTLAKVVMNEKLPSYVVPDLTGFKLKPYVSQCPRDMTSTGATATAK